jgi:hypothetical protein
MFQAIAWGIDAPEERKVGPLAAHDGLDAVDEQPLARAQRDVGMRRIRLNGEDVPLILAPDADAQLYELASVAPSWKGRRDRPAAVDDQQIAGTKETPQLGEIGMADRPSGPVDDHQANAVAASPAELDREVGAKFRGQGRQRFDLTNDQGQLPPGADR